MELPRPSSARAVGDPEDEEEPVATTAKRPNNASRGKLARSSDEDEATPSRATTARGAICPPFSSGFLVLPTGVEIYGVWQQAVTTKISWWQEEAQDAAAQLPHRQQLAVETNGRRCWTGSCPRSGGGNVTFPRLKASLFLHPFS